MVPIEDICVAKIDTNLYQFGDSLILNLEGMKEIDKTLREKAKSYTDGTI